MGASNGRCGVTGVAGEQWDKWGRLFETFVWRGVIRAEIVERAAGGPVRLYCTVGVHPTRALEFLADGARAELELALGAAAAAFDGRRLLNVSGADMSGKPVVLLHRKTGADSVPENWGCLISGYIMQPLPANAKGRRC